MGPYQAKTKKELEFKCYSELVETLSLSADQRKPTSVSYEYK